MKLLYCLALFGTVYSLTFLQLYLETLAAVTRCNDELNSTATVYIKDDSQVLVQLLQNNMSEDLYDAIVDEYIDCMLSNNSLPLVTIFGDDENVFLTAHECTLTLYLDLVERSEFDDLELVVPLRPNYTTQLSRVLSNEK